MFFHRGKFLLNIFTQSTISSGSSSWICFFPNFYYLYFRTDERLSSLFLFLFILEMFFSLSPVLSSLFHGSHVVLSSVFIFKDVTLFIYSELHLLATQASLFAEPRHVGLSRASLVHVCQPSCPVACGGLNSPTRRGTCTTCIERWPLNHWTTRKGSVLSLITPSLCQTIS